MNTAEMEREEPQARACESCERASSQWTGPLPCPSRSPNSNDTAANTNTFILKHVFKVSLDFLHSCSYRTHSSHERQKHSTEERVKQQKQHDPHPTTPSIKSAQRTDPEHVTGQRWFCALLRTAAYLRTAPLSVHATASDCDRL